MSPFTVIVGHAERPRRERYVRHYIGQSNEQSFWQPCRFHAAGPPLKGSREHS